MRKPAFSLIELLVVVAILIVTSGFAFITFFRSQDRWLVENTGKEIITYLRQIQSNARNGDRGAGSSLNGGCNQSTAEVARGESKLTSWVTVFYNDRLTSYATCSRKDASGRDFKARSGVIPFEPSLPAGFVLRCGYGNRIGSIIDSRPCAGGDPDLMRTNNDIVKFDSLFGDTTIGTGTEKNFRFILFDEKNTEFAYQFNITNGAITNGCFCTKPDGSIGSIGDCTTDGSCPP